MAVISKAIPTLLRGVSQAADLTKQPDHADIQDNANSSPVQGLIKRSGSQYITNISNSTLGNVHVQTINRDVSERYIAVFSNGDVKVYDLAGNEKTVNKPDGVTYLTTTNPRDEIKTVTIADYTFVVNTSIAVEMDTAVSQGSDVGAIVFINQVSASTDYTLEVDGRKAVYSSGTSNLRTSRIAERLAEGMTGNAAGTTESGTALSGFTITQNGSVLWIKKDDGSDFSIDVNDDQGNSQITLVKNSVQTFTDLPTTAPNNFVVEVKGDHTTNFDNYYVKFVTNNGLNFEEGQWEETLKAGITYQFNYDKIPHILLRQADGSFRFARADGDSYTAYTGSGTYSQSGSATVTVTSANHGLSTGDSITLDFTTGTAVDGAFTITVPDANTFTYTAAGSLTTSGNVSFGVTNAYTLPKWGERTVGDTDTAPDPTFVGTKINNVFFFRNRLGFLADDNVSI